MGQQQLLLIVLGVIIVGIAVVVGINVFTASSLQANIDGLTADVVNLGSMAQQYHRKPTALGGGGNSFVGWAIPSALDTTGNGTYVITGTPTATQIVITGTGNEIGANGTSGVVVTATVSPTGITTAVTNN
ncbi:MAG: hypothetical protein KJ571_15645 [Bacteroidetes bacterium]|nr:hypothetical protein [Bacteroidota bacterium]